LKRDLVWGQNSQIIGQRLPLPKHITAEIVSQIFQTNCRFYSGFTNQTHELTPKAHDPLPKYVFHLGSHFRFDTILLLLLGSLGLFSVAFFLVVTGKTRVEAAIGLKNLAYNFRRYVFWERQSLANNL